MSQFRKYLFATSSSLGSHGQARRLAGRLIALVFAALFVGIITPIRMTTAATDGSATVDDKAATNGGAITVVVKYNKAGTPTTVSVPVTVTAGDSTKTIRNSINTALSSNATLGADFTFATDSKLLGEYQIVKLTKIAVTTIVTDVHIENTGIIKGPTFGGGSQASLNFRDFFTVAGTVATANDSISVKITTADDIDWVSADVFELASYDGLSPTQIASDLAALINASPLYDAILLGNEVLISGDINTDFGTHILLGPDTLNITGAAGVHLVPVPSTLGLLLSGLAGLFVFRRQRAEVPTPKGAGPC